MTKTLQQAYEYIRKNLVEQQFPSRRGTQCKYRGPQGRRCAVGWLISDEAYTPALEGTGLYDKVVDAVAASGWPTTIDAMRFYVEAQAWHDHYYENEKLDISLLDAKIKRHGLTPVQDL